MSAPAQDDPRPTPAPMSDERLLAEHERMLETQPDERAHYRLLPLYLLFVFSGLILFAATYLNRYQGYFSPMVYDENMRPSTAAASAPMFTPVQLGDRLFHQTTACVQCHQATGLGLPGTYPPLAGSEFINGPQNRVVSIVLYGLQGPVHVEGKVFQAAAMPSFGPSGFNWSDEQIAAVLTYVRQEWGNKSPAIDPSVVAAVRAKDGSRGAWSEAELLQIK